VRDLAETIAARGEEIDRERRIPSDLVDRLVDAGCYRMLVPASHGGDELDLREVLDVIETLAEADGAVGWTLGQVAFAQLIFAHFLPAALARIYADGPNVFGAGVFAPKGRAVRRDGGWEVSGEWPFATGCDAASWFYVHCVVVHDRKVQVTPAGTPLSRMMLLPAKEVEILDTWRSLGLRGTASHDIRIRRALCADECSRGLDAAASLDGAIHRIPLLVHGSLVIAAAALGIARGATNDIAALAADKRPSFSFHRLAESRLFQDQLGEAYVQLEAGRALLRSQVDSLMAATESGHELSRLRQATVRSAASFAMSCSARVVDTAYRLAGGSSVYDGSGVQRRFRDIHTALQHAHSGRQQYAVVGAILAGGDLDETQL
jgi:alkylation response protein AidB-like acyl-CoA dehydrogenase